MVSECVNIYLFVYLFFSGRGDSDFLYVIKELHILSQLQAGRTSTILRGSETFVMEHPSSCFGAVSDPVHVVAVPPPCKTDLLRMTIRLILLCFAMSFLGRPF